MAVKIASHLLAVERVRRFTVGLHQRCGLTPLCHDSESRLDNRPTVAKAVSNVVAIRMVFRRIHQPVNQHRIHEWTVGGHSHHGPRRGFS